MNTVNLQRSVIYTHQLRWKIVHIFSPPGNDSFDFGWLQSSAANVNGTDEDIQNQLVTRSTAIPPALGEIHVSPVKFGPVTSEISMWNYTHPKRIFRKTIFRPLGGAASPNFYTR